MVEWRKGGGRMHGAILAIRTAIVAGSNYELCNVDADDDMIDDLALDELEIESFSLIIEEVFGVVVPEDLFRSPLYRTAESFAEWVIARSDALAWARKCA